MGQSIFDQLTFLRYVTLYTVQDINEREVSLIPEGFNNNILWNLGHIYLVQEQFAFSFAQEPMEMPAGFMELFAPGTKPSEWTIQPPPLPELLQLLKEQSNRIREKLNGRLDEEVAAPLTLPGLTLHTIGELLTFNLYHEGVHVQTIRMLKKLNER